MPCWKVVRAPGFEDVKVVARAGDEPSSDPQLQSPLRPGQHADDRRAIARSVGRGWLETSGRRQHSKAQRGQGMSRSRRLLRPLWPSDRDDRGLADRARCIAGEGNVYKDIEVTVQPQPPPREPLSSPAKTANSNIRVTVQISHKPKTTRYDWFSPARSVAQYGDYVRRNSRRWWSAEDRR